MSSNSPLSSLPAAAISVSPSVSGNDGLAVHLKSSAHRDLGKQDTLGVDGTTPPSYELTPLPKTLQLSGSRIPSSIFDPGNKQQQELRLANDAPEVSISPVTQEQENPIPAHLRAKFRRNGILQFSALCWSIFLIGWNDGTTGPLLPRIQHEYNLGFAIVSLIFVANCIGYVCGAMLNVWLTDRLGLGKIMVAGAILQLTGYVMITPAPPFPVIVCAYAIAGLGISLQNAQANGFLGSLNEHMSTKLGILHGLYGLGAFLVPFVATDFSGMKHWSFHFIISSALQFANIAALVLVFRFRPQEEILADAGQAPGQATGASDENKFKQMFRLRALHFLAAFAIIYIGVEVTLGGWIVTFIIRERRGGPNSGYISSGFFGGLTLGRLSLIWVNKKIGEERVMFIYSALAIGLELTIWFVPSIIENAVAVSIIGLLLGPMFPIVISHSSRVLPRWLLTGCVGWITGIGVSGSAALPFITGLLASKYGIRSLQPLMVSMMSAMLLVWVCVPKAVRRVD